MASFARADVERKAWLHEQMGRESSLSLDTFDSHSVQWEISHFRDSLTSQARGDVKWGQFDFQLSAGKRLFLNSSDTGRTLSSGLRLEKQSAGIEIGRRATLSKSHFGRLGIGYQYFVPEYGMTVLCMDTGIFPTVEVPWGLHLHARLFLPSFVEPSTLLASVQSTKKQENLEFGAEIAWIYRMRDLNAPQIYDLRYEHMLFTIGPLMKYHSKIGDFRFSLNWRVWLDVQYVVVLGVRQRHYPSDISPFPDGVFSWTLAF